MGYPSQEKQVFTYDAHGRLTQTDHHRAGGSVDAFKTFYDAHGRVLREESPAGAVNYEYDPVTGLRSRVFTGPGGPFGTYAVDQSDPVTDVVYRYDALGRLSQVVTYVRDTVVVDSDPLTNGEQPELTTYHYDVIGNLDRTDLAGGAISDYVYDSLNRLNTLTHYAPDGTPEDLSDNARISQFPYSVRADGRRESAAEIFWLDSDSNGTPEEHASNYVWAYDELGRLISEAIDHFDNALDRTESFVYDLAGNRRERTVDSVVDEIFASDFDANDRLIQELIDDDGVSGTDRTVTYSYYHTQQAGRTVDHLKHGITNAASESINAKIQWVKYTARGFRNFENFKNAIYFHCGDLDLSPQPT